MYLINELRTILYKTLDIDPFLSDKQKEIIILSTAYNSVGIQIYKKELNPPIEKLRYVRTDRLLYTSGEAH